MSPDRGPGIARWSEDFVAERWESFTRDEREALLRFGHRQAKWETVPDAAQRLLKCDANVSLEGARSIDAVFRSAYEALTT